MRTLVRITYFFINIILVALLLCCIATKYVNPNTFQYFEILGILFPFIFIANCIAAIFWLLAKDHKHYCLASIVSILLSLPIAKSYYSFNKNEESTNGNYLKILSYNVEAFNIAGWKNRTETQTKIYNFILNENPDIICFQEFHHDANEQYQFLSKIKNLGLNYIHTDTIYSVGKHHFQGNCICSRFPIIKGGIMRYQKSGNTTTWADIVKGKDTIRVFNNHLESYRLTDSNLQIVDEIEKTQTIDMNNAESIYQKLTKAMSRRGVQTDELTIAIANCPYQIICCGDFNSLPCSYTYQSICASKNLQDAFLESGSGVGDTFNKKWWSKFRLDYILYSPSLSSKEFKRTKIENSDHYPISCKIAISD